MEENKTKTLTEKEHKRARFWIYAFLILSITGMLYSWSYSKFRQYNPEEPAVKIKRLSGDPISITKHVRVSGVDYDIPVGYFNVMVPYATENDGIYLTTLYPDFLPLQESKKSLWKRGVLQTRGIDILAHGIIYLKDLQEFVKWSQDFSGHTVQDGKIYGLEKFKFPKENYKEHGVSFLKKENDKIITFIACTSKYSATTKVSCGHRFTDKNLHYKVTYRKKLLPHWQKIEEKTLELFKEFQKVALDKNLNKVTIPENRITKRVKKYRLKQQNKLIGDK